MNKTSDLSDRQVLPKSPQLLGRTNSHVKNTLEKIKITLKKKQSEVGFCQDFVSFSSSSYNVQI